MPFDNTRFALLAVLCGLAAQSLSPFAGPGVRAGVVHRQSKAAQANQFARHDTGKVADYDAAGLHHSQASFSSPWSRRGHAPSKQLNHVRNSQKSTIVISNARGAKYMVNHRRQATTPQWISMSPNRTLSNTTASTSSSPDGMPGTVAIVSSNADWHNDRVLASLFLVNQSDGTYVLDASDRNATEVFLTPIPSSGMNASASDTYPARLVIPIERTPYCATYDQAPRNPEPLTAQQCTGDGVRSSHTSQIFIYNSSSGVIQPTYIQGQSVDAEDVGVPSASPPSPSPSASMGAANAGAVVSSDSAYPSPSASASSASWNRRDDSGKYTAQNVTLVFVPKRMPANAAAAEVREVSTSTVTSTQTVILFSSAVSPSASAVNTADSTPSFASRSGSSAIAGATGLSVEVVGNGLPQAPLAFSSVGMVAASRRPAPSPTSSNTPSPSIDAAAVAASSSASGPTTPSPSSAGIDAVASLSPSDSAASMSSAPASSSARPLFERAVEKVAPVSTEPYFWRFKTERI